ncbi:MAG: M23 family metallopeptidase [Parvularculaceae bacterium]|nr:M23 family metallopeptidase [Parvularculaceae bacterium]
MMTRLRLIVVALLLGACATAPPRVSGEAWSVSALELCPGVHVSNAPATNAFRGILAYTPFTSVRGITVARAPVESCVSSAYGPRATSRRVAFHNGLDLYTGDPRAVVAGAGGRISFAGDQRGYGLTVEIEHGRGVTTRYAHLSDLAPGVREGQSIGAGTVIASTGRSGNATAVHLHYEILIDGRAIDPLRAGD